MNRKITALMAAALLSVSCLTGCGESKPKTKVIEAGGKISSSEPEVTLPAGVEYTANKGEEYNYENLGLKINFKELALTSDETDSKGKYSYAMVFTASNNGSGTADIRMLDDFCVAVDGVKYEDTIFTALSAANGLMAYPDFERYDTMLEPGQTITGFVPFGLDTMDWNELEITYYPDRSRTNDTIVYKVARSEVIEKF